MKRRNRYLDELGIPRVIYVGNFVTEKKVYRMHQRLWYGFDYRNIFNMDTSFAEWLYSHLRMYKDCCVNDGPQQTIVFDEKEYSIEEAVNLILEKTGEFLKFSYYSDVHLDYAIKHPALCKLTCMFNPTVRFYLQEYNEKYEDDYERFKKD